MSLVLAIVNQKGGVGKTTTTINLSAYLASKAKRTLLIDMDPQGNATSGLGIDKNSDFSIYDVIINGVKISDTIKQTGQRNLSLCLSNIDLAGGEVELVNKDRREYILKAAISEVREKYDFILIDCPPSLGLLTLNSLTAADGVIIPVQSEYYALEGVTQLMDTLSLVTESLNPALKIFGVVVTMYDSRTILAQQVNDEINKFFKNKTFKTVIPRNIKLSEAPSFGKSIYDYDSNSKGAQSYYDLANEVIDRSKKFWSQN